MVVHGDDVLIEAEPHQLKWMEKELKKAYQLTCEVLGPGEGEVRELRLLNRILTWTDAGLQ